MFEDLKDAKHFKHFLLLGARGIDGCCKVILCKGLKIRINVLLMSMGNYINVLLMNGYDYMQIDKIIQERRGKDDIPFL